MIVYNNQSGLTEVYLGTSNIAEVYIGSNKVFPSDVPPVFDGKLKIHTSDFRGNEYWREIPCDGNNHLTQTECHDLLYQGGGQIVIDVYVGDCVEVLESDCFYDYSSTVGDSGWTLYLPSTLKQWINTGASSSDGLKELKNILPTIPSAITSLPTSTFGKKFTSYVLPNTVVSIGSFFAGSPLTSFTMSESQIETGVFDSCTSLSSITIPASVLTINNNAFNSCSGLKSLTFNGNNVISIGENAFSLAFSSSGWSRAITLPNSVETIGANAFEESKILSLTIGTNITSIGNSAFAWSTLENIIVNATTPPTLGTKAFDHTSCTIYVPSASLEAYKNAWSQYTSRIQPLL
jgi:hypothetical protein